MQQRARNPVCIGLVLSASAIAQASYQGVAVSDPDKPSIIIDIDAQRDVPPGGGVPYDDVKKLTRTASSAPAAFTPVSQSTLYFVATRHDGCRYLFRYVTLKPTDEPNYAPVKAVQSGQPDVALLDPTHLVAFNGYLYCFGVGAGANRNLYRVQDLVATKLNLPPSTQAWNLHDLALGRASLMVAAGEASPTGDSTNLVLFTVPVTGLDCIKLASTAAGQSHLHVNDLVDCNSLAGGFVAFTELSDDGLTRQLRRGVVNGTNLEFSAPAVVPTGPITDLTPVGSTLYYTVVNYVLAPDASRTLWFAPNYSSATMTYVTTDVRTMVVTPYLGGKRLVVATGRRQMNNQVWAIDGTPLMIPPPQDTELYAITDLVTYLDDVHLLAVHRNVT